MSNQLYRKPVSFNQYYFLLVKSGRFWCLECGSWDKQEMKLEEKRSEKFLDKSRVKLCTSPSDDERVIQRIIREYNRYA